MPSSKPSPSRKRQLEIRDAVQPCFDNCRTNAGHVSRVLQSLENAGILQDAPSEDALRRKQHRAQEQWRAEFTFTTALPLTNGKDHSWRIVNVLKATESLAQSIPAYRRALLESVFQVGQETPVILYCDEATPGNPLAPSVQRKSHLFYLGYKSLGSRPGAWTTVACLPSQLAARVKGGLAAAVTVLLRSLLPTFNGVSVQLGPEVQERLFVKLRLAALSADEAGLAARLAAKGASARRPCWMCQNLISQQCRDQLLARGQRETAERYVTLHEADAWNVYMVYLSAFHFGSRICIVRKTAALITNISIVHVPLLEPNAVVCFTPLLRLKPHPNRLQPQ